MSDSTPKLTAGMFTSRTEEWETPQYVFDALNAQFHFTLDVCATPSNRKCLRFFTKDDDALTKDWGVNFGGYGGSPRMFGNVVWMNPPYGREIYRWMEKAYRESRVGTVVVCLVPSRTDTKWWHDFAMKADEIRFVRGRLKFGDGKQSAPFPSCIIIFRGHINKEPNIKSVSLTTHNSKT